MEDTTPLSWLDQIRVVANMVTFKHKPVGGFMQKPSPLAALRRKASIAKEVAKDGVFKRAKKQRDDASAAATAAVRKRREHNRCWWTDAAYQSQAVEMPVRSSSLPGRSNSLPDRSVALEFLHVALERADLTGSDIDNTRVEKKAKPPRKDCRVFYRCDIYAKNSPDYTATEAKCKGMVVEAGGTIIDAIEYIGSFLYYLPDSTTVNPLVDKDGTAAGGHIEVRPWTPSDPVRFNGLRMNPPGLFNEPPPALAASIAAENAKADEEKAKAAEAEEAGKRKMQDWILKQRERAGKALEKERSLKPEENDADDLALGPTILDPGVELAIMQPSLIQSSVSQAHLNWRRPGPRASWAEKEVYVAQPTSMAEEVAGSSGDNGIQPAGDVEAIEASGRASEPVVVHDRPDFSEELERTEFMHRNWVAELMRSMRM